MCLYSRYNQPHSVNWDIPCYKLLRWNKHQGIYETPITHTPVLSERMVAEGEPDIEYHKINDDEKYGISEGYIHVFGSYYDAKMMAGFLKCTIHAAIIPKNTNIFVSCDDSTICAKKVILKEKLE